jgi:hypothetical protein
MNMLIMAHLSTPILFIAQCLNSLIPACLA